MKKTNLLKISFMVFFPFVVVANHDQDAAQVSVPDNLYLLGFEAGDALVLYQQENGCHGFPDIRIADENHVVIEYKSGVQSRLRLQQVNDDSVHNGLYFWIEVDRS